MKKISTFIISSCLIIAAAHTAHAQAGCLDNTFGNGGKVTTDFGNWNEVANEVILQPDGKIIAAGTSHNFSVNDFVLARYKINGSLDSTFGSSGKVKTDFGTYEDYIASMALQPDGKIVVAGGAYNGTSTHDIALARYNSNGSLDSTFGSVGKIIAHYVQANVQAYSVALQTDGKIVVSGSYEDIFDMSYAVLRYNLNGSLDSTFGTDGLVITNFGNGVDFDFDVGNSVAIQNNGKIVVAGQSGNDTVMHFSLARYNSNGILDSTFSADGKIITAFGNIPQEGAYSVTIQADGKIVVTGVSGIDTMGYFTLVRYNTNGNLDSSFGTAGKVLADLDSINASSFSVALQPDGKILVAGLGGVTGPNADFLVVRFNTDGSLDQSFCSGGKTTTDFMNGHDYALSIGIQSDGKIVVAGATDKGVGSFDFALARYTGLNVGIDDIVREDNRIMIYPNPATSLITAIHLIPHTIISIINLLGEVVISEVAESDRKIIDVSLLPAGMYFLNKQKFIKE